LYVQDLRKADKLNLNIWIRFFSACMPSTGSSEEKPISAIISEYGNFMDVICTMVVLNNAEVISFSKSLLVFQMGNTGSFSHFCSDQAIPDDVNNL